MWIVFSVFAVLWFTSIEYSFPGYATLFFFAAAISAAAYAVWPKPAEVPEHERVSLDRLRHY